MKTVYAKIAVALTLATLSGIVHAQSQIPEICYTLYSNFTQSETYGEAGETAWRMMEENCWPSLQNPIAKQQGFSDVTDCASLEPYIIDLMQNENPNVIAFHGMKKITPEEKAQINFFWMSKRRSPPFQNLPSGVSRVVDCVGDARYSDMIREVEIYLDKDDATGQFFYGITPISVH